MTQTIVRRECPECGAEEMMYGYSYNQNKHEVTQFWERCPNHPHVDPVERIFVPVDALSRKLSELTSEADEWGDGWEAALDTIAAWAARMRTEPKP